MAFNLTTLANYTKDNADKILTGLVADSPTAELIAREGTLQTGIKTSERVAMLTTEAVLQNGDGCGFTPLGDTQITQRLLTVATIKVNEEYCLNDLEKKFTQLMMQKGSNPESMPAPIEEAYVEQKISKIEEKMEKLIWQGDTASGNSDLNYIDGFIKIIDAATGVVGSNASARTGTITSTTGSTAVTGSGTLFTSQVAVGDKIYSNSTLIGTVASITNNTALVLSANGAAAVTAQAYRTVSATQAAVGTTIAGPLTLANVSGAVDALYLSIPQRVLDSTDPAYLFMGTDVARMWLMALKNANQFHFTVNENDLRNGFSLPGFPIKVRPTPGLSGTGRMYVIQPKNLWLGTDLENEWEQFKMWFSDDDDKLKFKARWRIGVQVGYPDEITQFQSA